MARAERACALFADVIRGSWVPSAARRCRGVTPGAGPGQELGHASHRRLARAAANPGNL